MVVWLGVVEMDGGKDGFLERVDAVTCASESVLAASSSLVRVRTLTFR